MHCVSPRFRARFSLTWMTRSLFVSLRSSPVGKAVLHDILCGTSDLHAQCKPTIANKCLKKKKDKVQEGILGEGRQR